MREIRRIYNWRCISFHVGLSIIGYSQCLLREVNDRRILFSCSLSSNKMHWYFFSSDLLKIFIIQWVFLFSCIHWNQFKILIPFPFGLYILAASIQSFLFYLLFLLIMFCVCLRHGGFLEFRRGAARTPHPGQLHRLCTPPRTLRWYPLYPYAALLYFFTPQFLILFVVE